MSDQSVMTDAVARALTSKGDSDQQIYHEIIQLLSSDLVKSSSIIDVGMGQGKFLKLLGQLFPNLTRHGADAADYGHASEIKQFICDFNSKLSIDQQFDLVTSIEVIEHLRDPRHFVNELVSICKSGGKILITTPNNESYNSLLSFFVRGYFSAFSPRDYPAHITPITEYQLTQIVYEIPGLKIKQVYYFKNGRIPGTGMKWHRFFPFFCFKYFIIIINFNIFFNLLIILIIFFILIIIFIIFFNLKIIFSIFVFFISIVI